MNVCVKLFNYCFKRPICMDYSLLLAFVLDALLGDPRWLPHPIRLFGWLISRAEGHFNRGRFKKVSGVIVSVLLISGTWFLFSAFEHLVKPFPVLAFAVSTVVIFFGIANRCLIGEVLAVERALTNKGLDAGRKQLSWIVGRDTHVLNKHQIRTAALETLSENLSDGVVAPLFYFAIAGFPGMMAYKMVNTLDSMIGYKNERYQSFGWFAARIDDVLNFIPARLTAFMMLFVTFRWSLLPFVLRQGRQHSSPNSGYPEAALAGILDGQFGGPNYYRGILVDKPYIGVHVRCFHTSDVRRACQINALVALFMVLLCL
jgi:adenosylcobinamide-phosphate synthase